MTRPSTRIAAAFISGALALSGGAVLPMVATAQVAPQPGDVTTVDLGADVSLTIEKYLGEPTGGTTAPGLPTVAGVEFLIERIALTNPLDTAAGWVEASDLEAGTAALDGWETTVTTGADGTVTLTSDNTPGFGVGVYRVTEIQEGQFTVAPPFLVSLPYTTAGGWEYEQTVRPKNQQIELTKDVADEQITLGEDMRYTITTSVPAENLTYFRIEDVLEEELTYNGGLSVTAEDVDLTPGTDYTATEGQTLSVEFTPTGRAALQAARVDNPALAVTVAFDATVNALPTDDGVIENHATVYLPNDGVITTAPGQPGGPTDPEIPNAGVTTRINTLTITKNGEGFDEPQTMEGATFELWRCTEDGDNWELTGEGPLNAATAATPADGTVTSFTTPAGADNTSAVTLYGVQAYNWVNSAAVDDEYCVVETVAPEGFSLNPQPQRVYFENEDNPAAAQYRMVAEVTNQRDSILAQLPATGGKGAAAILLAGLLFVGGGVWLARRANRHNAA